MTYDLDARMQFAIDLARRAGELGLKYFRDLDSLTIESKGHQDLVSQADREVELFIRAAIAKDYPQDGIVGEEHASVAGSTGYVWVIDPIDGTANFVRGIPAWRGWASRHRTPTGCGGSRSSGTGGRWPGCTR